MKLVLRGLRRSGKSALVSRLRGLPFSADYVPTREITTSKFVWTYKATEEQVTCEVWDVVDRALDEEEDVQDEDRAREVDDDEPAGAVKRSPATFRVQPPPSSSGGMQLQLDAEHIDVHSCANAVVILYDVSSRPSFEYAKNLLRGDDSLRKIPVLLLGNFVDRVFAEQGADAPAPAARAVPLAEVESLVDSLCGEGRRVQGFECSLLDCYGLRSLHSFFNIPFLELKAARLNEELKRLKGELATVR